MNTTRSYTYRDDEYLVHTTFKDALTTVSIVDLETELTAKGHALWFHEDSYNEDIGQSVAFNRAMARLARKNEKWWISQTQPRGY